MITENMTIQGLHVIFLALTPMERWEAARGRFDANSAIGTWLTVFAVLALIISLVLLFWVFATYRRSANSLNQKITELTILNIKLRQENTAVTTISENLQHTNEKLQQENAELYHKQVRILENIVENPKEVNPSVN